MRTIVGLWRWRGNPLCRRSDRREAWVAVCAALLILVGAPLVGLFSAEATHDALLRTALEQQQNRHRIWATAQNIAIRPPLNSEPDTSTPREERTRVNAHWTGPDGSARSGTVAVGHPVRPGSRFPIWTDDRGLLTDRPMSTRGASSYAMLAGLATGAFVVCCVEVGRRLTVRLVLRRRYARWDEEWGRIGPDWGRAGTSN